jgi:hypothetical protein
MSKARLKSKNILGIAEGGTGATSMGAGAVGTVSQTAGVPTGALFEVITNANGRAIKYADGTLVCERYIAPASLAVTSGIGSIFYAFCGIWTYPVPFVGDTPNSICTPISTGQVIWAGVRSLNQSLSATEFAVYSAVSYTAATSLVYRAWGRWF